MDRRDFLKTCVAAGIGLGSVKLTGLVQPLAGAAEAANPGVAPEIVAVRNGEPEQMFDRGIAAMGGMGRFVKRGQTVAIKPNISWDSAPEMAGNTNPALVHRIVQHCREAGAAKVTVFDHTIEQWRRCWDHSQIGPAAMDAGAIMAPGETDRYYVRTPINGGVNLHEAAVHEAMLEADVLISVPILKHHGGAGMTASMKNFMGAVWDRRFYHGNGLQQCIADFMALRRPDLTVLDAYRVLTGNGPNSRSPADVQLMKMQVLSTDVVAADASGARILGRKPEDFLHVVLAHQMGFGQIDPTAIPNRRISL